MITRGLGQHSKQMLITRGLGLTVGGVGEQLHCTEQIVLDDEYKFTLYRTILNELTIVDDKTYSLSRRILNNVSIVEVDYFSIMTSIIENVLIDTDKLFNIDYNIIDLIINTDDRTFELLFDESESIVITDSYDGVVNKLLIESLLSSIDYVFGIDYNIVDVIINYDTRTIQLTFDESESVIIYSEGYNTQQVLNPEDILIEDLFDWSQVKSLVEQIELEESIVFSMTRQFNDYLLIVDTRLSQTTIENLEQLVLEDILDIIPDKWLVEYIISEETTIFNIFYNIHEYLHIIDEDYNSMTTSFFESIIDYDTVELKRIRYVYEYIITHDTINNVDWLLSESTRLMADINRDILLKCGRFAAF